MFLVFVFGALFLVFLVYSYQFQLEVIAEIQILKSKVLMVAGRDENKKAELPVRLIIPKIKVNANIQFLGVNKKGEMEVPSNNVDVGWFQLGSVPGEKGSAVFDGHFNGVDGGSGVFASLDKLVKGDKIFVENAKGSLLTFVVRDSRVYNPGYSEDVFGQNDGAYLNLITCDGLWDKATNGYNKRLVVFAELEE